MTASRRALPKRRRAKCPLHEGCTLPCSIEERVIASTRAEIAERVEAKRKKRRNLPVPPRGKRLWPKMRKLDEAKVREIRAKLAEGAYGKDLAHEYGVSDTTISNIRRGDTWGHVA